MSCQHKPFISRSDCSFSMRIWYFCLDLFAKESRPNSSCFSATCPHLLSSDLPLPSVDSHNLIHEASSVAEEVLIGYCNDDNLNLGREEFEAAVNSDIVIFVLFSLP